MREVEQRAGLRALAGRGAGGSLLSRVSGAMVAAWGLWTAGASCDPAFTALPIFNVGMNGGTSAVADLDGDGLLDLTTGYRYFLGDGEGAFPRIFPLRDAGAIIFDVAVRDFDGDGFPDLALASMGDGELQLFFGREAPEDPSQLFEGPVSFDTVGSSWHIACPDVNEDGRPDLAAVSINTPVLAVHVNNGDRTFAAPLYIPMDAPGHPIASGDFDGDGHEDLAVGFGEMAVLEFGRGDGTFRSGVPGTLATPEGPAFAHRFRAADLDGDGRSELVVIATEAVLIYDGTDIDPEGGLPPLASRRHRVSGFGRFLEIADMNGDGALDLLVQTAVEPTSIFYILRGEDGSFVAGEEFETGLSGRGAVLAVGDINGDSWIDVVLTTEDTNRGRVFLNDGSCGPSLAEAGDANADGAIDLGDPIAILGHLFGGRPLECGPAAEVNVDGRIDLADPVYLLSYLFAQGSPPPPGTVACRAGA